METLHSIILFVIILYSLVLIYLYKRKRDLFQYFIGIPILSGVGYATYKYIENNSADDYVKELPPNF